MRWMDLGNLFQPVLIFSFSPITGCTFIITSPNNGTLNGVFDEAGYYLAACSAVRNATIGKAINPVQSA